MITSGWSTILVWGSMFVPLLGPKSSFTTVTGGVCGWKTLMRQISRHRRFCNSASRLCVSFGKGRQSLPRETRHPLPTCLLRGANPTCLTFVSPHTFLKRAPSPQLVCLSQASLPVTRTSRQQTLMATYSELLVHRCFLPGRKPSEDGLNRVCGFQTQSCGTTCLCHKPLRGCVNASFKQGTG